MNIQTTQFPCRGCVYFNACGSSTRTAPCEGRVTVGERNKARKAERYKNRLAAGVSADS